MKRPHEDIEDPQDPNDTYPPSTKRRIDDKSKTDMEEPRDIYDIYQPHKVDVDLKNPTDAIVIQDEDIDPNLVVSFSDNESIDDCAQHLSWSADMFESNNGNPLETGAGAVSWT